MTLAAVRIWTDGACLGNPGPGGWAALIVHPDGREEELAGGAPETTNNRMELQGAIAALEALPANSRVELTSDSKYVLDGITQWIAGWKRRAWKDVKNRDLWERLDAARARHRVEWRWVRGHTGDPMNERADRLAVREAEQQKRSRPAPVSASAPAAAEPSAPAGTAVQVWTDGACLGNPGPGGWAALLVHPTGREEELSGGERETTNNRMELLAAIAALEALPAGSQVELTSDSKYVLDGITQWIAGWKRRGWKDVKNRDLWERLDAARARHEVQWRWVRGHTGDPMNERADKLAVAAAERQKKPAGR